MSLLQRKKRPIQRDAGTLRDDRLFFVACDDTYAPKQYFDAFRISRVQIHVVPTEDGSSVAKHVLARLDAFAAEEDDERWMLLDTDHCTSGTHLQGFLSALQEARQKGVKVALSKPCFEVWLLLHRALDSKDLTALTTAKHVDEKLGLVLGSYNKTRLDPEHFPLSSVRVAFGQAMALDAGVGGGDNPDGVTTRVYQLWQSIVSKALPSQLPDELRGLNG